MNFLSQKFRHTLAKNNISVENNDDKAKFTKHSAKRIILHLLSLQTVNL